MPDFHNYAKQVERALRKFDKSDIKKENKAHILRFINECYAEGLSHGRIYKYLYHMTKIAQLTEKDLLEVTKDDVKTIVVLLDKHDFSDATKRDFRVALKKFYKVMEGNNEQYPEKVKWIKTTEKNNQRKLPEDLLKPEDVRKMIQAANNPRDKALIFVLYESGCRFSELMSLKMKSVQFDKYGAQIVVSGKTGSRRNRLITSCDYLRHWIENHPQRNNSEAPLWVSIGNANRGRILNYASICKRLREIAVKAGVMKRVNPHNFRHSQATYLANKISTPQLCIMFGWSQHSRMPSTYIHLSGEDVDNALLKMHGLKKDENDDAIVCPRCQKGQLTSASYCKDCGIPLNLKVFADAEEERSKYDNLMDKLLEDKEVQQMLAKKIKEINHTQQKFY